MQIKIEKDDVEYLIGALECRLREIGKGYEKSYAEDTEITTLQNFAKQLGVYFQLNGGNTGFTVVRESA